MKTTMTHCPACGHKLPWEEREEHPDDRKLRLDAEREAVKTIGPFWREHWREFVALVQTYADMDAHEKLEALRRNYWSDRHTKGAPPKGAR